MVKKTQAITAKQRAGLLKALQARFEENSSRHEDLQWAKVQARLEASPEKIWALNEMERTGGEPDVVGYDKLAGEYVWFDCAPETPEGRRNVCYDAAALAARKVAKPKDSAVAMAAAMGIELLTEVQYRELQQLGAFDTKTSSWLNTPPAVRKLGGAIFGDRRFGRIFVYHNGAESYYGGRGFRGALKV